MATNESLNDFGRHQESLLELTGHCGTTSSTSGDYLSMLCFENHTIEDEYGLLVHAQTDTATSNIVTAVNASNCDSPASSSSGTTSLVTNKRRLSGESRKVNKRTKLGTQNQNSCSTARPSKGRKESSESESLRCSN
ncbi:hypothetical protein Syun_004688 [Stephania yunnanensis]|uniref:Uncharacterized protein n=1 Tax=Stephania yunnanensis TaxID=152371 RepID=A0AAP0L3Z0_9MAGN